MNRDKNKTQDAGEVVEQFLTAVRIDSALYLDFEKQLLAKVSENPWLLEKLRKFTQAIQDPETRTTMDWLFSKPDLQAAIVSLLQQLGVKTERMV
jgi:hypothetical protein